MSDIDTMKREAAEHIENVNAGIKESNDKILGDIGRALVWTIRKVEAIIREVCAKPTNDKGTRTMRLPFGTEVPLERGLTFRDLLILIMFGIFIYLLLRGHGLVP